MKDKKTIEEMIAGATPLETTHQKKGGAGKASISIVNSENNGKRIILSNTLIEKLGRPKAVQFLIADDTYLLVGENLNDDDDKYEFSKEGGRIIYSSSLVHALVESFNLDYNGKVSASFDKVKIKEYRGHQVAIVKMN